METIHLKSDVRIKAASAAKSASVAIVAYTGGVMNVANFGHVVIDLAGLVLGDSTTILSDHDADLGGVIGSGRARVEGGKLIVAGRLAGSSETAQRIIALHKEGISFQASVGVEPVETERSVREITANGRRHVGKPSFIYIKSGQLREVTICALGADEKTEVAIAAGKRKMTKRNTSTNTAAVVDEPEIQGDDPNADDVIRAERERVAGFSRILARYPGLAVAKGHEMHAQATEEGWTADQLELAVMRAERPAVSMTRGASSSALRAMGNPAHLITSVLMLRAGRGELAQEIYGEHVAQGAHDLRCRSLLDVCAAALRTEMRDVPRDQGEMIRAAFSTMSLPTALGNFADKVAAEAFRETPSVWTRIARRRPVNNFREHRLLRMFLIGHLEQLPPDGQIKHATLSEDYKSVQAVTKAKMLGLSRQDIINDDLSMFADVAQLLGRAAMRTMSDDFAGTIMGSVGTFFAAGNNNVSTTGSALAATSLAAALSSMTKQTDAEGRSIDVRARVLLVPPEMEYTARQLVTSTEVARYTASGTDNAPTGNPLSGAQLSIEVEPRLSNTALTGNSTTAWYLFAASADGAVNVALLGGRDTPVIEQEPQPFNMLGTQYRAYHDFGFSVGEPAAAHRATGAA
ncbi:MAG: Mu-like prophage major head subunit gpT family protein [Tepidisphaeraceae bacterium]